MIKRTIFLILSALLLSLVGGRVSVATGDENRPTGSQGATGARGQSAPSDGIRTQTAAPLPQVSPAERSKFERWQLPSALVRQWSPPERTPPEQVINDEYIRTRDDNAARLSLKEAVYLAIRNNPGLQAERLEPLVSLQSARQSDAIFDPDLTATLEQTKATTPTLSTHVNKDPVSSRKDYDWNFGVNKLLSTTNGTLGVLFANARAASNSVFSTLNPAYQPGLTLSLSQPLLRNLGFQFSTINVRIAELNQMRSQFDFERSLSDFVLRVATDYWSVVRAEENLQVALDGLGLARDLVRQNQASLREGMISALDLTEAQSQSASREAAVFAAQNSLDVARANLRRDVLLNPSQRFLSEPVEPTDRPDSTEAVADYEEQSLELAMRYRPELESMRQAVRSMALQVRYAENQTLPTLNLGAQFGVSSIAGTAICHSVDQFHGPSNCLRSGRTAGVEVPFGGPYGDALNRMWDFKFYNYAVALNVQQPLMNDASKAALAQARIELAQQRLRYRDVISQIVDEVEASLSQFRSAAKRAGATRAAAQYANDSLRAEQARYHDGMATTHELLQFQDEQVSARANHVQAQIDRTLAQLALRHAEGTLLRSLQINFVAQDPHEGRWYDRF
jgi:outer membrane protein